MSEITVDGAMRRTVWALALAGLVWFHGVAAMGGEGVPTTNAIVAAGRPAEWAQLINKPGLPNLHKVSDNLYRGAQPTAEGMKELEKMGIKTVMSLRAFHSDADFLKGTSMAYEHIPMNAWHAEEEDILKFLAVVRDAKRTPMFVHCQHGADRTGTMCAIYRIVVQGWTKEQGIREMRDGGFGFHEVWQNLVDYIGKLDVESIKRKAGIKN